MELSCSNCGFVLESENPGWSVGQSLSPDFICPVCEFQPGKEGATGLEAAGSINGLEKSLTQVLIQARESGLSPQEILAVLKKELEFEAELASPGHTFMVQVIDLGVQENWVEPEPIRESREILNQASNY